MSQFCILPQDFKEFYDNIDAEISHEDYIKAKTTVDKYVEQKEESANDKKKEMPNQGQIATKSAAGFDIKY